MIVAPLVKLFELNDAVSLSKYGKLGYKTPFRDNLFFVKITGFVIDIVDSEEKNYTFLRVDDGTGSIQVKFFGPNDKRKKMLKNVKLGDFVLVVGQLRHWRDSIYVRPISLQVLDFLKEIYYRYKIVKEYEKLMRRR